jgi:hypothetical protein
MARTLTIPLATVTTVTSTRHGQPVELPIELIQAIDTWYAIKDDQEADRVGLEIQRRIDQLCHLTPS